MAPELSEPEVSSEVSRFHACCQLYALCVTDHRHLLLEVAYLRKQQSNPHKSVVSAIDCACRRYFFGNVIQSSVLLLLQVLQQEQSRYQECFSMSFVLNILWSML